MAVIGGGAAGIAAAHALQCVHDVTLFESDDRLGGHAHSVELDAGGGERVEVDTAFLIFNRLFYPRFVALLRDLDVLEHTQPAEMSTSFLDEDRGRYFALGRGVDALFYQRRNAIRPGFYRTFLELAAFRRRAYADLTARRIAPDVTLATYLARYSSEFREGLVVPLAMAIWSVPAERVLEHPARSILEFFLNHRLLKGPSGKAWHTFEGGSGKYVRAFRRRFKGTLVLGQPVKRVLRSPSGIRVVTAAESAPFDRVVMATHADVALGLLESPTAPERSLLGAWRYHANPVTLHTDASSVHADRRLWSSWNVLRRGGRSTVTYYLNRVQSLRCARDFFLTLGESPPVRPGHVVARFSYRHPIFDAASVATQRELPTLDGGSGTYFCGSYAGHGFHEDAVASGFRVARALGAETP